MANKKSNVERRKARLRYRLRQTANGRLRLSVFRSNAHIYAQIIDDEKGITLAAASTVEKEISLSNGSNIEAATKVGELIAKRGKEAGVETVVFDRGAALYHGRVKALADAAREGGLVF